ncbi:MAG: efflux RND transporter periplasmic adaptor subunit [Myxococcota bacterium]|nr:efflux RND transporter periplasmic adaptor subunit [Myxococcota bacterium]
MIRDTSGQDRILEKPAIARGWRRWVSVGLVAVVVIVASVYLILDWLESKQSVDRGRVRIAKVERGTLVRDVVADGRVVATNSPTLYSIAGGTVEFRVRPGDKVTQGQVLATITSPDLQSKLAQEQITLAGLEAGLGRAGLEVEHGRANAQKLVAQANVDRLTAAREVAVNEQLYGRGVVAELELRRSEDALRKAEIALKHAHIEAGLQSKELEFDRSTRTQSLGRQQEIVRDLQRQVAALELQSPVDGQVGQLLVAQRATVAANAMIVTVVDLRSFELEIRVPDSFALDLAIGMAAEVRIGAGTVSGRVRSVSPEVTEGTVATRIEFADPHSVTLRQNQRLTARIVIDQRPDVLKVERGPFLEQGGGNFVFFVEAGFAERRPIKTGAISLNAVEILSGAKVGDEIVVSGADTFGTAQRVRIAD